MDETTGRRQAQADFDNIERQVVEAIVEERTRCHEAALACWRDIADFRGMDHRATKYVGILAEEIVTGCSLDPGEESPTMAHIWDVYVAAEREAIVRFIDERYSPQDSIGDLANRLRAGEHYAVLQEAQGPVSAPAEPEASADSCTRKGGTESPDTSG